MLLPHEVLQLDAEYVIAFAGGTPPARLNRIDWRSDRELRELVGLPAKAVSTIRDTAFDDWAPVTTAGTASTPNGRRRDD